MTLPAPAPAAARTAGGWQRPIRLAAPVSLDVLAPEVAFSARGASAIGYSVENVDDPAVSRGMVVQRSVSGRIIRARRVPGAQQVLALAFSGNRIELLTGTSPGGLSCCSSVDAVPLRGGPAHRLVNRLAGATNAGLVALGGRLLAVVGTERGVWVAQSAGRRGGERFGRTHHLAGHGIALETLDATSTAANRSVVCWAGGGGGAPGPDRTIFVARGSATSAPSRARRVHVVRPGHSVDELALAGRGREATVAWIESWTDASGRFHSQAMAADLTRPFPVRRLSSVHELAAGLSFASDPSGDQAVAWKSCGSGGSCSVRAALRPAGSRFGSVHSLGAIDSFEVPAVAVSAAGQTLLGWIRNGHVVAAEATAHARRFGRPGIVSATNYATDLTIGFGPGRTALATWVQGTLGQAVMGAVYAAP